MTAAEDSATLHSVDTRLTVVEAEVHALAGTNKWIRGIALVIVLQIVVAAMGFARLAEQVDNLNLDGLKTNTMTALQVLGDHGTELQSVRQEQARLRGANDAMRAEISQRTADRFTGRDGDRIEARLDRLENIIYAQD